MQISIRLTWNLIWLHFTTRKSSSLVRLLFRVAVWVSSSPPPPSCLLSFVFFVLGRWWWDYPTPKSSFSSRFPNSFIVDRALVVLLYWMSSCKQSEKGWRAVQQVASVGNPLTGEKAEPGRMTGRGDWVVIIINLCGQMINLYATWQHRCMNYDIIAHHKSQASPSTSALSKDDKSRRSLNASANL